MAKTKQCPLCGKEYKSGFFSKEESVLIFGKQTKGDTSSSVTCCFECSEKYNKIVEKIGPRFSAKIANIKKYTNKTLNDQELTQLFLQYYEEYHNHQEFNLKNEDTIPFWFGFTMKNGMFFIPEFDTSNSDYSSDKGAALILNQQFSQPQNAGKYLFTKDDISRIEYKKIYKDKYMGQGFFVYEICFNDPRTFTYKPVFTRCILQKNGMFGLDAKADKSMEDFLNAFQGVIGSNLQVVKVSKYS